MLGEDAAAIVNSAPIDPDFQQGCSQSVCHHNSRQQQQSCVWLPGAALLAEGA
jgi:hypothetical protein